MRYFFGDGQPYAVGGVMFHFNNGTAHGGSQYEEIYSDLFTLIGIGSGIQICGSSNLEFMYYYPLNRQFGYTIAAFPDAGRYNMVMYGMFKLGWGIYF